MILGQTNDNGEAFFMGLLEGWLWQFCGNPKKFKRVHGIRTLNSYLIMCIIQYIYMLLWKYR